MKRIVLALLLLGGCKSELVTPPADSAELALSREADGRISVVLRGATAAPRALQAELVIDSTSALIMEDAAAPQGQPLDTVRLAARGTNRAILFSGDKRGVRLSPSGPAARFRLRPASGSSFPADATVRIASATVVGMDGTPIPVRLGGPIPAH